MVHKNRLVLGTGLTDSNTGIIPEPFNGGHPSPRKGFFAGRRIGRN